MARATITVGSLAEADAVKLALEHPALKAASLITGLLLQLPSAQRPQVMHIVESQLLLTLTLTLDDSSTYTPRELQPELFGGGDERLRLHDGDTRDTGE